MTLVRATKDMPSYQRGFARSAGEALYPGLWRGLVGAWMPSLGPSGGQLFDVSGYGNHGALTNMEVSIDWIPTEKGYALDFDGSNEFVGVQTWPADSLSVTNQFSFVLLVRIDTSSVGTNDYLYLRHPSDTGKQHAIIVGFVDDAVEFFSTGFTGSDPRTGSQISVPDNTSIHQYAYTYNGSTWTGYLDGIEVFSTSRTFSLAPTIHATPTCSIFSSGAANYCDGAMVSFSIHNRALSPQEIRQLYIDPMALVRTRRQLFGMAQIVAAGTIIPIIMAHGRRRR